MDSTIDENIISQAIEIAKANRENFCALILQMELNIGKIKSMEIIHELEKRSILAPYNDQTRKREVLI